MVTVNVGAPQEAEEPYFRQLDAALKFEPRAVGGEPCQVCGEPIAHHAHFKHRDRHVCSPACNLKLVRRYKSKVKRGLAPALGSDARALEEAAVEAARPPRRFATHATSEFPYEHARWPIAGDVVERHGVETAYVTIDEVPSWPDDSTLSIIAQCISDPNVLPLAAVHVQSGAWTPVFRNKIGAPARMELGRFIHNGVTYHDERRAGSLDVIGFPAVSLARELISDVTPDGLTFRWEATLFTPLWGLNLWTPERLVLSDSRRRASASRGAYLARMRARGDFSGEADYIDPHAVFDAAGWMCGVCGDPMERTLVWPDPWSATLDHVQPVSRSGEHVEANLQPAHWICNVIKGNSEPSEPGR